MKLFDIAFKDMRQSLRSLSGIMFMFVVPVLVTVLFYFMFGGASADDEDSFALPRTDVLLVNLDAGTLSENADLSNEFSAGQSAALGSVTSMGELLAQILQQDAFADLLAVREVDDATAARTAVDNQEASVAIIIPSNFTDALLITQETAVIELYQDPTLTIGPAIVESLIKQFADSFVSTKIGTGVVIEQLVESGAAINGALVEEIVRKFTAVAMESAQTTTALINVQPPPGANSEAGLIGEILGQILGGMMTFFAFFTGSAILQSILIEEEQGTLARLFTTPTQIRTIIGGKVTATFLMLFVQVTTLLLFGRLVFKINWGTALPIILAVGGIIVMSVATGLLLVSLMKNTRQAGVVYGGVLTLTGMIGMITIFTGGGANTSPMVRTVSLFVPQGWAVRGLQTAMNGGTAADILPTLAGLLVWVVIFAAIGQYRLQRRFA